MPGEHLNPSTVHQPTGYTHAVKVANTVYVAGQIALAQDGTLVGEGDVAAQAEQVYHNLQEVLKAVGASLQDVVKVTTYLTRAEDLTAVREVRARHFTTEPPASTLVVVSQLARSELLIEIEAIAVLGAG